MENGKTADQLKLEILEELTEISGQAGKWLKWGLLVVGAGVVGYNLVRSVTTRKKKNELVNKENELPSYNFKQKTMQVIRGAILTFILGVIKDKLIEYIEKRYRNQGQEKPVSPLN